MYISLALFGLLFAGAYCGENDFDAVVLNSNLFGDQPADNSQYWWMSKGSPFKRAVAAGPPQQQFDFAANPFLRSNAGNSAKLYSAPGYLPPEQQRPQTVPCQGNGRVCVPKYQCQGGYVDASQVNGQRGQECNIDSEVCCQVRVPTPAPRPQPTTQRNTYIPPPPPTPRVQPPPPSPPQPQPTPCYERGSVCAPANQCYNGAVQRGSPYAQRSPASQCLAPEVCCRVPAEPRPTPAQSVTVVQYQPSPTTQRPYVTPAPRVPQIPKKPLNNQYLPPRDNEVPQGNNPLASYLPPQRGQDEKSPQIEPNPSNVNPSVLRPGNDELSQPITPPSQCPAATNCTEYQFCNADGTISTSPVNLTPEQETYRVPLSACRDESKGISQGVCCRDPNYTDPWPTNLLRTGAFDANVLAQAFDDGQYKAPSAGGRNQKRGEALKSPINPINPFTASSQQTKQYTIAPFIPNAIPNNNQPIKTSVSQQPTSPNPFNNQPNQQTFSPPSQFNTPQQNNPSQPKFVPQNRQPFASQPPTPLAQASTPQLVTSPLFPTPSPANSRFQQPQAFQPDQPSFQPENPALRPPQQDAFQPPQQPQGFQPQQPFGGPEGSPLENPFQPQQPFGGPEGSPLNSQNPFQPQQPFGGPEGSPLQNSQNPFQPSSPQAGPQASPVQNPFRANQLGVCSVRDQGGLPRGNAPNEAAFGEFPWQAMILRESTKSILCGGAIIERNLVVTAAHCVDGLRTHDVLIKGGEWKLGSTEEPKPFQTVRVKQITMHPAYEPTNLESDVALLHLENDLKFDKHIGPICVDESELEPTKGSDEECVTSGWGKEIIKYHVAGSLPHSLAINPMTSGECQSSLNSFNPNSAVCGRAQGNPCDVDNGSALACTRGNGRYLLKGIYSTESGCGPNQVMKFTKMDVDFIKGRGSGLKSLPINSNSRGASQPSSRYSSPALASNRGLKKYLPPQ